MKGCRFAFLVIGVGLAFTLFLPVTKSLAHAELRRSDPAAGATLDRAPTEVFVWFSMPLSTGSKLSVYDGQFQVVDKGETFIDASDAKLMRIRLEPIGPGRYTVSWKAAAVDGHVTSGSFDFYVQSAPDLPIIGIVAGVGLLLFVLAIIGLLMRRRAMRIRDRY